MPPTFTDEGIHSAIRLRSKFPRLGVLIFTHHVESDLATELLGNGAGGIGYLLKERVAAVDEFVDALRHIAAGGTALDPELIVNSSAPGVIAASSTASPPASSRCSG